LGIDTWYPGNIPMPNPIIRLAKTGMEGIKQAVRATYDIYSDDRLLRNDPGSFEFNRGNYPVRREFHNYTVETTERETGKTLRQLGFKVKQI